ncbi:MAG: RnfABCDGE type electron transport complex subunit B [Burkholderiales bacterium]|nr:RnfABCDGE type electron transport complex subunit B [Burkholderiales bacterium]
MLTSPTQPDLDAIDVLLPQTQCQRCGYADCHAYAQAIASGEADINRCPPGGDITRNALAALLGREPVPPADDVDAYAAEHVALIDEAACIGCAACLPVCPTDAIVGASKRMHTVMAADCTGCELCILACPVDCIALLPAVSAANRVHTTLSAREPQADALRAQYRAHQRRYADRAAAKVAAPMPQPASNKQALLAEILARAKARATTPSGR